MRRRLSEQAWSSRGTKACARPGALSSVCLTNASARAQAAGCPRRLFLLALGRRKRARRHRQQLAGSLVQVFWNFRTRRTSSPSCVLPRFGKRVCALKRGLRNRHRPSVSSASCGRRQSLLPVSRRGSGEESVLWRTRQVRARAERLRLDVSFHYLAPPSLSFA